MYIKKLNPMILWVLISLSLTQLSVAKSATVIDAEVETAIKKFQKEVTGGAEFLSKVKGYLVFPSVIKGGFIVGGEYGEGALRVNGVTKHYYSITSASLGYQIGVQKHTVLIAFLSEAALNNFIRSNGWEAGVDGSITVSDWGKSKDITSMSYEKPIVAFIYGEEGLMAGVSIEGTKFQRILPN
ncbi:MAG TPA: YSC84-related protein [Sulfurovum sp.]|uniref:lipid-binding SYLF domain-containing protein n=1 Tax=Sulfurovum sp. TaxID=1969726 RepID=UPI002F95DA8F